MQRRSKRAKSAKIGTQVRPPYSAVLPLPACTALKSSAAQHQLAQSGAMEAYGGGLPACPSLHTTAKHVHRLAHCLLLVHPSAAPGSTTCRWPTFQHIAAAAGDGRSLKPQGKKSGKGQHNWGGVEQQIEDGMDAAYGEDEDDGNEEPTPKVRTD